MSRFSSFAILVTGIAGCSVLACAGSYFYWLDLEHKLDQFCAEKKWNDCARLVNQDLSLHWPFATAQSAIASSPALIVQNYFLELSGGPPGASTVEPPAASNETTALISERARLFEYQLKLPHLAESYIRCAVGLYRKQTKAALAQLSPAPSALQRQSAAEALERLARALRSLAELYQRHGKYLIAERAFKECIDVATQAFVMSDQGSRERMRAELLTDFGAHIKILNDLGRTPEAEHESKLLRDQ